VPPPLRRDFATTRQSDLVEGSSLANIYELLGFSPTKVARGSEAQCLAMGLHRIAVRFSITSALDPPTASCYRSTYPGTVQPAHQIRAKPTGSPEPMSVMTRGTIDASCRQWQRFCPRLHSKRNGRLRATYQPVLSPAMRAAKTRLPITAMGQDRMDRPAVCAPAPPHKERPIDLRLSSPVLDEGGSILYDA
jgi:hypothetical protein